ncbi:POK19 protein, partial [Alaudala cheleensis]|nr:POK19 protein [Alaudala cheleensis]
VEHKRGIPYSPTGQTVVERTHQTLKRVLEQQKEGSKIELPPVRLSRVLFTINFLNYYFEDLNPPVLRHFNRNLKLQLKEHPPVLVKNPEMWQ